MGALGNAPYNKNLFHKFVTTSKKDVEGQFEVWLLLREFFHILNSFTPSQWDWSMQWAVDNLGTMHRPSPWMMFNVVPLDTNVSNLPGSGNARIADLEPSLALDIDSWA